MPKAAARFSGGLTSAMYALAAVMLAVAMPESTRPAKSHAEVRRERHDRVVDDGHGVGQQDHGTAPDAVGEHAQQRRAEELHERPGRREQPDDLAACAKLLPTKLAISFGNTGPIIPNVSMSMRTVTKMKMVAPRRALFGRIINKLQP